MHEKLVRKGCVPSILILLRDTQDDMCRRMACLALANLASHVFTRVEMAEQGVVEALVPFINDEVWPNRTELPRPRAAAPCGGDERALAHFTGAYGPVTGG